jgi:adenylyltransferase/sulfurtransferase
MTLSPQDALRYSRQLKFAPLGESGQERLMAGRVAVIGCGALGSVIAEILVRGGVGYVRLVDRDFVDLSNLPRQSLFDEADVARVLPKAIAAADKLRRMNSAATVEPVVEHVTAANVERLTDDVDLVLDGTDNFPTRFLVNDAAVKHGRPWIFGAALAAHGMMMVVRPGLTPCLRCVLGAAPPPGSVPTCDESGVLASTVHAVAALECTEAVKLLADRGADTERRLVDFDLWAGRFDYRGVSQLRGHGHCRACEQGQWDYLNGAAEPPERLAGRDGVHVLPPAGARPIRLRDVAAQLLANGLTCVENDWLVRFAAGGCTATVFADGRAIVQGLNDAAAARTWLRRYVSWW